MSKLYSQKTKNLLQKLRCARLEVGLTQIEAGKKLKKPQSYLSKVERGERKVEAIELADFAKIYNKDINYFIKQIYGIISMGRKTFCSWNSKSYDKKLQII